MATNLSSRIIKARKVHDCDASCIIEECISEIVSILTFKEKRAVVRMIAQKGKILPGQKYLYQANIFDGDFCIFCADLEMHQICARLDLYVED